VRPAILDSCAVQPADEGSLLIAAWDPFLVLDRNASRDPLEALAELLGEHAMDPLPGRLPAGAAVGALSYDLGRRYERLPATAVIDAPEFESSIALYDRLIVHDYTTGRTTIVSTGLPERWPASRERAAARAEEAIAAIASAGELHRSNARSGTVRSNFDRASYSAAVVTAQQHIAAGDIYQVNLTQRFTAELGDLSPIEVYLRLRERNPAAFAAFLAEPGRHIVSASPERFLRVEGRRAEMWPIKGTRPRGETADEDARLAAELLSSAKDHAENVMIVDLVRNDLGRVAEYGTVRADEICALRALPTVFHLVSRVSAELRSDASGCDVLRAAFPCGSITGAPKIRAMQLIEEFEGIRRGVSMGAVGYASFDGSMDWSVAIRTLEIHGSTARFNVGGGVVADSDPDGEYDESLWKARAIFEALGGDS